MAIELTDPSLTTKEYDMIFRYLMDWDLLPEPEQEQELEPEMKYEPAAPKKKTKRIVNKWIVARKNNNLKKVTRNLMRDLKYQ